MISPELPRKVCLRNERSLQELAWLIEASLGQFSLILANCNDADLRESIIQQLQKICSVEIQLVNLKPSDKTLYTAIRMQLGNRPPSVLMVLGLEVVEDIEEVLMSANRVREEFRKTFAFPLVLWVNNETLGKLMRLAPDLENWALLTEFLSGNKIPF